MKIFEQDGKKASKRQKTWSCIASSTAAVCTAKRKDFTAKPNPDPEKMEKQKNEIFHRRDAENAKGRWIFLSTSKLFNEV
jgi:hypothetical protein